MYVNVNIEPNEGVQENIKKQVTKQITETLTNSSRQLESLIKEIVRGSIKQEVNAIIQSPEYRKKINGLANSIVDGLIATTEDKGSSDKIKQSAELPLDKQLLFEVRNFLMDECTCCKLNICSNCRVKYLKEQITGLLDELEVKNNEL